jgi:hypothetical protein
MGIPSPRCESTGAATIDNLEKECFQFSNALTLGAFFYFPPGAGIYTVIEAFLARQWCVPRGVRRSQKGSITEKRSSVIPLIQLCSKQPLKVTQLIWSPAIKNTSYQYTLSVSGAHNPSSRYHPRQFCLSTRSRVVPHKGENAMVSEPVSFLLHMGIIEASLCNLVFRRIT